jgi:hypothetical protein
LNTRRITITNNPSTNPATTIAAIRYLKQRVTGDESRAITGLIASIALVDTVMLAMVAVAASVLTLIMQHGIPASRTPR